MWRASEEVAVTGGECETVVEGGEVSGVRRRVGVGCVGPWRPSYAWRLYSVRWKSFRGVA